MNKTELFKSLLFTFFCFIIVIGSILFLIWLVSFFSKPICTYMFIVSIAGGFGGLCYSLVDSKGQFKLCKSILDNDKKPKIDLGSIPDILIGMGAAFAVFLVLSGLVALTNDIKTVQPNTIFVLASLGIVSGFGGKIIFPILVQKLEDMIKTQKTAEKAEASALDAIESTKILQAQLYSKLEQLDDAEAKYQEVINNNPKSVKALVGLAVIKGKKKDHKTSIELCTKALALDSKNAYAYYNRACGNHLLGRPFSEVRDDLKKAIEIDETFRKYAADDSDFKDIMDTKEFKEIVNLP